MSEDPSFASSIPYAAMAMIAAVVLLVFAG
jgi:hypothetical protein